MPYSVAAKNSMLDHLRTEAVYVSLHITDPGDSGTGEVTGGSPAYARKPCTWGAAAGGAMAHGGRDCTGNGRPDIWGEAGERLTMNKIAFEALIKDVHSRSLVSLDKATRVVLEFENTDKTDVLDALNALHRADKTVGVAIIEIPEPTQRRALRKDHDKA